jgi:Protein of unknown function (DUF3370)
MPHRSSLLGIVLLLFGNSMFLLLSLSLAQANPLPFGIPIPQAPPIGSPSVPNPPAPASPTPNSPTPNSPTPLPQPLPQPPNNALPAQESIAPQDRLFRQEVMRVQEVRPLPGQLDAVPVFNSNSPEMVMTEGILLSTFPTQGMRVPSAHLNYTFNGRFDFFSHHISRASNPSQTRTLFQGVLVYNPGTTPATIEVLQGASYLTRPDALFVELPHQVDDPNGRVYSGPGSRVANDILRGRRQGNLPLLLTVPPGEVRILMNLPIPAGTVTPTSNGRSTLMRLKSDAPVHLANLAMFAPQEQTARQERVPSVEEWVNLLINGSFAGPRDIAPSPLNDKSEKITYGRVAGVAIGSQWGATLTDGPNSNDLTIPQRGRAFSYGISLLPRGTFGTGQVQSAALVARYADTANLANGNYGIQYSLTLPLYNNSRQPENVAVMLETPIKQDASKNELLFLTPPEPRIFYRGPVRVRYQDARGIPQTRFVHLVQRRGEQGDPLSTLTLAPGDRRKVEVDFLYPPDATPPQILTVTTIVPTLQTTAIKP